MRLLGTKLAANSSHRGFGDQLYDLSGGRPSLDLNFADTKSLVDATTGQNLVTFTRASSGTYVNSQGVIKTATTNEARFDHAPTTGESLGLLVEEQRTNLLLQSNGFDTTWTNSNSSETAAAGTAPDGTNTAWELKDTLDTVATAHALAQTASFTSGTSYTLSCWMKAGTLNEAGFTFPSSAFTTAINCRVNLTTGAVLFSSAAVTTSTTLFANGWVRVVATATATATATSATLNIRPMNGAASYIGTGTGTILIWGAQLEAGAFPTSYIPTTTATATRSADVASITGSSFSSWYRQDEGTVFSEFSAAAYSTASYAISDGTNSNRIMVDRGSTGTRYVITNAGVAQSGGAQTPCTLNSFVKTSLGYALDNCNLAAGGVLQTLDTSATIPSTVDRLLLGVNAGGAGHGNGPIKRFTFWPRRLSDPTLQGITQ